MGHCIIIGSGPGLGSAIARKFGLNGHWVSLLARNETSLREQCTHLTAAGVACGYRVCDAADEMSLRTSIEALEEEFGPCTTMIYNAAVLRSEGPLSLSVESLKTELDVNLIGAFIAAQCVATGMMERGSGAILFTGGGLGLEPYPEWTSLALGKAALRNLAFSLYKQLSPGGVHVAVIAVCGIVEAGGPFDPAVIADAYFRMATCPKGVQDRELIFQPSGTDLFYNDPRRIHKDTTIPPVPVSTENA